MKYFLVGSRPKHYPQRQPAKNRSLPRAAVAAKTKREVPRPVPKVAEEEHHFREKPLPLEYNSAVPRFYAANGDVTKKLNTAEKLLERQMKGAAYLSGGLITNTEATIGFTDEISKFKGTKDQTPVAKNILITETLKRNLRERAKKNSFFEIDGANIRAEYILRAIQTLNRGSEKPTQISFSYLSKKDWDADHKVLIVSGPDGFVTIAPYVSQKELPTESLRKFLSSLKA